jgi:hypothetical protein
MRNVQEIAETLISEGVLEWVDSNELPFYEIFDVSDNYILELDYLVNDDYPIRYRICYVNISDEKIDFIGCEDDNMRLPLDGLLDESIMHIYQKISI